MTFEYYIYANILHVNKNGFRAEHPTTHQLHRVVNLIRGNKHRGNYTCIITQNVEKAFDTIWHDALIFEMSNLEFPYYFMRIIHSFLKNRTFNVQVQSEKSTIRHITDGVSQGSVLSPTLFSLYMTDTKMTRHCIIR